MFIISLVEILTGIFIYNILINNELFSRIKIKTLIAIITSVIYTFSVNVYKSDQLITLVGLLFLIAIMISKLEDKDTIITFIELLVCFIVVLVLELIATFIMHLILGNDDVSLTTYYILITTIMISLVLLLRFTTLGKKIRLSEFLSGYKSINIIILNLFVFFLFIKLLASNDLMDTEIVIQVTVLGLILLGINCYFYIYLYKVLNEKKSNNN